MPAPKFPRIFLLACAILVTCLTACATQATKRVILEFDGKRYVVETEAATVQDILREQNVPFSDNDRIDPPIYAEVARSATIECPARRPTIVRLGWWIQRSTQHRR